MRSSDEPIPALAVGHGKPALYFTDSTTRPAASESVSFSPSLLSFPANGPSAFTPNSFSSAAASCATTTNAPAASVVPAGKLYLSSFQPSSFTGASPAFSSSMNSSGRLSFGSKWISLITTRSAANAHVPAKIKTSPFIEITHSISISALLRRGKSRTEAK